jgi:hypothetical protein
MLPLLLDQVLLDNLQYYLHLLILAKPMRILLVLKTIKLKMEGLL